MPGRNSWSNCTEGMWTSTIWMTCGSANFRLVALQSTTPSGRTSTSRPGLGMKGSTVKYHLPGDLNQTRVIPTTTTMAAPHHFLNINTHKCTTGCSERRCTCKKAGVRCSAICKNCCVTECENSPDPDFNEEDTDNEDPTLSRSNYGLGGRRERQRWR